MAKARSGPSRSGWSAPLRKSQRSFTRLAVHCISRANARHSTAGSQWNPWSVQASAEPIRTRMTELPRLYGLTARIQAERELVFTFRGFSGLLRMGFCGFSAGVVSGSPVRPAAACAGLREAGCSTRPRFRRVRRSSAPDASAEPPPRLSARAV